MAAIEKTLFRPDAERGVPQEYLVFKLGGEEYGIDILKVQEIRGYAVTTRIPDAPAFIEGMIDLRGTMVPIINMRRRFSLGEAVYDHMTVVIILNMNTHVVGMVVDSVSGVVQLYQDEVKAAPSKAIIDAECLAGAGSFENRMLILMDIEKLMASPDMGLLDLDLTGQTEDLKHNY